MSKSEKETLKPEEFGTGLRTHLERSRTGEPEPAYEPEPAPQQAAERELESEEAALEQRRGELAERREQIAAVEATLRVREQRIAEVRARLADEERRLSAAEAELTATGEQERAVRAQLRELLRERAEGAAELIWGAFESGLVATHADGRPDVEARVAAARGLLAEAYGETDSAAVGEPPGEAGDELAPLRERRREAETN